MILVICCSIDFKLIVKWQLHMVHLANGTTCAKHSQIYVYEGSVIIWHST